MPSKKKNHNEWFILVQDEIVERLSCPNSKEVKPYILDKVNELLKDDKNLCIDHIEIIKGITIRMKQGAIDLIEEN